MENYPELGKLISEHRENKAATGSTLVVGLVCLGMIVPMIIFFNGEKTFTFNKFLFGVCVVCLFLGGISCVWSYVKNLGGWVKLYENGLLVKKIGQTRLALWDEIAVVKESIEKMYVKGAGHFYDRYLYTLEKQNGETLELNNMVSNIDQIGQIIKTQTLKRLYPQAKEKINNGGQILFDSLSLDKNGLGGISWTELATLKVEDGILEIKDKKGNVVVKGAYAATPNAHLLIELVKEHLPFEE